MLVSFSFVFFFSVTFCVPVVVDDVLEKEERKKFSVQKVISIKHIEWVKMISKLISCFSASDVCCVNMIHSIMYLPCVAFALWNSFFCSSDFLKTEGKLIYDNFCLRRDHKIQGNVC